MHYEVELLRPGNAPDDTGFSWALARVFNSDRVPTPLTFDTLDQALAYARRTKATEVRIVRVDEEGREVIEMMLADERPQLSQDAA